jgi:hypothetical protein
LGVIARVSGIRSEIEIAPKSDVGGILVGEYDMSGALKRRYLPGTSLIGCRDASLARTQDTNMSLKWQYPEPSTL